MPASATAPPAAPTKRLLTAEEFLDWLQPGVFADLINGEIHVHSPVSLPHARLVNFTERLMAEFVERHDLGEVHRESWAVRLSVRKVFMPDISYFTIAQVKRLTDTHAPFAPALVVEVLSVSSKNRDTRAKFTAYEESGVQEYWILDPDRLDHHFYELRGGLFTEFARGSDEITSHALPGFALQRTWLNPKRLPRVEKCLAAMARA